MKYRNKRRGSRGFTLMEILLVLVILVVLGGTVAVNLSGARKRANIDTAKTQLTAFKTALDSYHIDVGAFPSSLEGLRTQPGDLRSPDKWRGPYSGGAAPQDPWGNSYQYQLNGEGFKIWSWGPNVQDEGGSGDDVVLLGE